MKRNLFNVRHQTGSMRSVYSPIVKIMNAVFFSQDCSDRDLVECVRPNDFWIDLGNHTSLPTVSGKQKNGR